MGTSVGPIFNGSTCIGSCTFCYFDRQSLGAKTIASTSFQNSSGSESKPSLSVLGPKTHKQVKENCSKHTILYDFPPLERMDSLRSKRFSKKAFIALNALSPKERLRAGKIQQCCAKLCKGNRIGFAMGCTAMSGTAGGANLVFKRSSGKQHWVDHQESFIG